MASSRIVALDSLQQFAAVNLQRVDPGFDPTIRPIPNCIEVNLLWGLEDGKQGHNVLHGSRTDGTAVTQAQANGILTALTTGGAWTALALGITTATALQAVALRDLRVLNQPLVQSSTAGAPGTSVSIGLPNEVAAVVTFRTALTGPGNRGRMYIPGFASNAVVVGNLISAAMVTAIGNWANTIAGALSAQGLTFCLRQNARLSYPAHGGGTHPARAAGTLPISSVIVRDNHWDSQRRRGLK